MCSRGKRAATHVLLVVMVFALLALTGCAKQQEPVKSDTKDIAAQVVDKGAAKQEEEKKGLTDPYYVLLIGNDQRDGTVDEGKGIYKDDPGRSDVMILARIDPTTYQISLLSIPRDTPYHYDDGSTRKINDAYRWEGAEGTRKALEKQTGLSIPYYFNMSFVQFANYYDAIGGMEVDVPIYMSFRDAIGGEKIYLEPGTQTLNGPQMLVFSRVRKQFVAGDISRQQDNRQIVRKTIMRAAHAGEDATKMISEFVGHSATNMPREDFDAQIALFQEHVDEITFMEGSAPYDGDWNAELNDWYCYENPDLWARIVKVFAEGGDPQTVLSIPPLEQA